MTHDETMREIGERLRTQDNACTAHPIFLLQVLVRDIGFDPNYADGETVWIDMESGDYIETEPNEPGSEEFGYRDRWETVMMAFTRHGLDEYMRVNGHNVKRQAYRGKVQVYADTLHRCHEMIQIRQALIALAANKETTDEA